MALAWASLSISSSSSPLAWAPPPGVLGILRGWKQKLQGHQGPDLDLQNHHFDCNLLFKAQSVQIQRGRRRLCLLMGGAKGHANRRGRNLWPASIASHSERQSHPNKGDAPLTCSAHCSMCLNESSGELLTMQSLIPQVWRGLAWSSHVMLAPLGCRLHLEQQGDNHRYGVVSTAFFLRSWAIAGLADNELALPRVERHPACALSLKCAVSACVYVHGCIFHAWFLWSH